MHVHVLVLHVLVQIEAFQLDDYLAEGRRQVWHGRDRNLRREGSYFEQSRRRF